MPSAGGGWKTIPNRYTHEEQKEMLIESTEEKMDSIKEILNKDSHFSKIQRTHTIEEAIEETIDEEMLSYDRVGRVAGGCGHFRSCARG